MGFDFAMVGVFALAATGFVVTNLLVGSFLRPKWATAEKSLTYECGERPIGQAWFNVNPRFYVIALAFVVFEVEIALTLPVALVFRKWVAKGMGLTALLELLFFLILLATGLVWIWVRRDLEWAKDSEAKPL